jgi:hypothetical protein
MSTSVPARYLHGRAEPDHQQEQAADIVTATFVQQQLHHETSPPLRGSGFDPL